MEAFRRAYLVCSTQRSGSTYLCQLLGSAGTLGHPEEFFEARAETGLPPHPGYFLAGLPRTGAGIRDDLQPTDGPDYSDLRTVASWAEHLERTVRLGTTSNGVFGAKLMWNQLPDLEQHALAVDRFAGLTGLDLLQEVFRGEASVRFIWMRRRDKVRQAVSLWRALQTRTWRLEHPGEDADSQVLRYSFEGIEHLRRRLSTDDGAWGDFFHQHGIDALELIYEEDVEPDPARSVRRVGAVVETEVPASWRPKAETVRQADELNAEWYDAYHRDAAVRFVR
jgi:LPS sulfotransferase NodH